MSKKETRMGAAKTVVAVTGLVAVFGAAAGIAAPATAEDSTTSTSSEALSSTVRKSISMSGDADGTINSTQMVTQVSAVGDGQMTVNVPIGGASTRNLDGFGSIPVEGQDAVFNLNVNGSEEQRVLSTAEQNVLSVSTKVTLDGKPIDPDDVVGKTGLLDVEYTVVNSGTSTQTVTFQNARGETITQEQEVNLPIGGSIDIDLPQGFNEITAKGANIGGDGMGQTTLGFSVVLFKPLGDPVATFGYQARITDGTIPAAEFTFLPIVPLDNPSVVTAETAFKGGAAAGTQIYEAGVQISDNLLKLQDGAAKLLLGLEAAVTGIDELASKLKAGEPDAQKLAAGAETISDGINNTLAPGIEQIIDGVTDPDATKGLQAGLEALASGLTTLQTQVQGLPATTMDQIEKDPQYIAAIAALTALEKGGTVPGPGGVDVPVAGPIASDLALAAFGEACAKAAAAGTPVTDCGDSVLLVGGYIFVARGVAKQLIADLPPLLDKILNQIKDTLLGTDQAPAINALSAGATALSKGVNTTLVPGLEQLYEGVKPGSDLADGAEQVAAGNETLSESVTAAADGSQKLADKLPAAVVGLKAAEQGAIDLREQGSEKLAATGETTEQGYALQVGQINALQQVGLAGTALPYGPATATGGAVNTSGVYQLTLQAAPSGTSNAMVFGLAALGLIAGGAVCVWAYRRRVV
jgi:putative membrane protein